MQQQHLHNDKSGKQSIGFLAALQQLPRPLADKFMKYSLAAVVFLILVITMLVATKSALYLWGLLFPVFFSYMALSLVWDWAEGKIICSKMLCVKASKQAGEQLYLILKKLDANPDLPDEIHKFHIPISKKEVELFSLNTILQVYYNPRHIGEMVAWEIIGNQR